MVESRPAVSVCIVTGRRPELLDRCLASLQYQLSPPSWELLVCSDRDAGLADLVHGRFPEATVGLVAGSLPGAARNFLVDRARGDLLLFLDDDVTVRPDLLSHLVTVAAAHPGVDVFGGPNETPMNSSRFQVVQGAVLASIVGTGPVRRRYGKHPEALADERSFTLCNLAIRRSAMLPFSPELICAEENALLAAMSHRGDVMLYDPDLVAYHERRPTWRTFRSQMFKYGRGRGQLLVRDPSTFRWLYLVPSSTIVAVTSALIVGVWRPWLLLVPLLYLVGISAAGLRVAWSMKDIRALPSAVGMFAALHFEYGIGVVVGASRRGKSRNAHWVDLEVTELPIEPDRLPM